MLGGIRMNDELSDLSLVAEMLLNGLIVADVIFLREIRCTSAATRRPEA